MIQVIFKNGVKRRFSKRIIGIDEVDIEFQKVLTKDEEKKVPVKKNGKWLFDHPVINPRVLSEEEKRTTIIALRVKIDAGIKEGYPMTEEKALMDELK